MVRSLWFSIRTYLRHDFWCHMQGAITSSDLPAPLRSQRLAMLTVRVAHAMCSHVSSATVAHTATSPGILSPAVLAAASDQAATAGSAVVVAAAVRQAAPQLSEAIDGVLAALPQPRPQWSAPVKPLRTSSAPFSPTGSSGQPDTAAFQPSGAIPMPPGQEASHDASSGNYGLPLSPFGEGIPGGRLAWCLCVCP